MASVWILLACHGVQVPAAVPNAVTGLSVTRFAQNPIITPDSSPTLGYNINGPSLIRVPSWLPNPLGKYYLYFAHHGGQYIRLAYADDLAGPWTVYEPGTLQLSALEPDGWHDHVASPDVHVDHDTHQIRMYWHAPRVISSQWTGVAFSDDGIHFTSITPGSNPLGKYYFRVWEWDGWFYAFAKNWNTSGELLRSVDGISPFSKRSDIVANMRHSAVLLRDDTLLLFYSKIGDAPERIQMRSIELTSDWNDWQDSEEMEVLAPAMDYEGIAYPIAPSQAGGATGVRQLRDPCIYQEDGTNYLLYTVAGEGGIAIARLDLTFADETPGPRIAVDRTSIDVLCERGRDPAPETVQIWNWGSGTLLYRVVESSSKFDVLPDEGSSTGNEQMRSHSIVFHTATLATGTYYRSFTVEDDGSGAIDGPVTVDLRLEVVEPSPATPTDFAATTLSDTEIRLTWTDNSDNEENFKMLRSMDCHTIDATIFLPANQTSYLDRGLIPNAIYWYVIKAEHWTAGDSFYTDPIQAVTLPVGHRRVQVRVAAGTDDAEERLDGGAVNLTSSDLELGRDVAEQLVGIRFCGLSIPQGAIIESAHVQFQTDETNTSATVLSIQAEAAENAAEFSAQPGDLSGRTRTCAAVVWNPPGWQIDGEHGAGQCTPDLSAVIRAVIARPGWQSGNALALLISGSGKRVASSFDGAAETAPLLDVVYSMPPQELLVARGAQWRYYKGTAEVSEPACEWARSVFDDSAWAEGAAPMGYCDSGWTGGTELTDMRGNYSSVLLRREFEVGDPTAVQELRIEVDYDDGFILWLNGEECARINVPGEPGTPVSCATCAVSNQNTTWSTHLAGGRLPDLWPGTNLLAAQVFNRSLADSGDCLFDLALTAVSTRWPAVTDADQNLLPDAWEQAHLADLIDPSDYCCAGDADRDGLSNLEEYIAGTDPRNAAENCTLATRVHNGQLEVRFQAICAVGLGYDGLVRHYAIEQRSALGAGLWTPVPGYEDILGTGQSVTYTTPAMDGPARYYRARVWLMPEG